MPDDLSAQTALFQCRQRAPSAPFRHSTDHYRNWDDPAWRTAFTHEPFGFVDQYRGPRRPDQTPRAAALHSSAEILAMERVAVMVMDEKPRRFVVTVAHGCNDAMSLREPPGQWRGEPRLRTTT